jgi:hypothetical protein
MRLVEADLSGGKTGEGFYHFSLEVVLLLIGCLDVFLRL